MLAESYSLPLIGGSNALPIWALRRGRQSLIHEPTDHLTVFDYERDFIRPYFQDGSRALSSSIRIAKTGIEEASIVDAKFTD